MYHDHHLHPFGYASLVNGLELMDASDLDEVMRLVTAHGEEVDGPIIGQRLNDEGVKELRLPTATEIDDVVGDRPVLLYRYCGHIAVANSAALRLAGIDADTPDPEGGSFDRDASGRPDGILRETAVTPVSKALEPHTRPPSDLEIISALAGLRRMGIGSITGMISVSDAVWCAVDDEVETLVRLGPDLPVDIDVLLIAANPDDLRTAKERIDRAEGPITFVGYKDFIDGSLGGHTAAMYEPFADDPTTRGTERYRHDHMVEMGRTSLELGGSVAIHAIGDRANDLALDAHEELFASGADPARLRVEHASLLAPKTIERMARLGVTASIQPAFLASEESWLEKRLGPARMDRAYPFRSLLEAGVPLLGGSDSPVELPYPETGINAAVDRHGINPEEALTRDQAEALFAAPQR
ncbi:MAG TPA: amidohydrolase [Acidimicrobiia bacterium]|nr:amidohydrolase [Acidimicrobiia bacterium]